MQIRGSLHSNSRSCPCRPARELLCREKLHTSFSRSDGQSSGSWDAGCSHLPNTDLQEQVHNHTHTCMQTHTNAYIPHGKRCPTSLRLWTQLDSPLNFPGTTQQIVNTTFYRTVERRDRLPVLSESEKCVHTHFSTNTAHLPWKMSPTIRTHHFVLQMCSHIQYSKIPCITSTLS